MGSALAIPAGWTIPVGTEVFDAERIRVGAVSGFAGGSLLVDTGKFFFRREVPIPPRLVSAYQDGRLYLAVAKEEALAAGEDDPPGGGLAVPAAAFAG